jgi:phosphoribosylanthranilate isomerase
MATHLTAKICGICDATALDAAVATGVRRVGFVFYPPSPRHLSLAAAAQLAARVPEDIDRVGVVVDPGDAELEALLARVPLSMIQLHGGEDPRRVAELRARLGLPVIKAIAVAGTGDLDSARAYEAVADWLLFDAKAPAGEHATLPGGRGAAFDWRLLAGTRWRRPWLLSGGLDADNVADAVRLSGARHVDVSSGVEDRPGAKSVAKIRAFLAALAAVDAAAAAE